MNRVAVVVCAIALSLLIARPMAGQGKKRGGNRGTATPVPLAVTIEALDSDGQACAICANDLDPASNPYVDGQDGVSAQLDEWGNLIVDFGLQSVEFTFANGDLPSGLYADSYIATRFGGALQTLEENTCAEMNWVFWDATTEYRLLFQRDGGAPAEDLDASAWALVTRDDDDTWTLEPRACDEASPAGSDYLAAVVAVPTKGKVVYPGYGAEAMPFKLTLTLKPQ